MCGTVVLAINSIVAWEMGRNDPLGLRWMVEVMKNGASNFLVLQMIRGVEWAGNVSAQTRAEHGGIPILWLQDRMCNRLSVVET